MKDLDIELLGSAVLRQKAEEIHTIDDEPACQSGAGKGKPTLLRADPRGIELGPGPVHITLRCEQQPDQRGQCLPLQLHARLGVRA